MPAVNNQINRQRFHYDVSVTYVVVFLMDMFLLHNIDFYASFRFHLNFQEINEGLPTIDTSKTDIWDVCPAIFKPRPCTISRFRSLDGHCNNIKDSVRGTSNTPFIRFLPNKYSNGNYFKLYIRYVREIIDFVQTLWDFVM